MEEIGSFNALFFDAASKKIRMENFWQDAAGFFFCCWRRDDTIYPTLQRRLPFNAAHDSYILARDGKNEAEAEEVEADSDLFG